MKLRFRPSVRAMMALVLVMAVGLGWVVNEARTQRLAVEAIERAGGEVTYSWQKPVGTNLVGDPPAPRWLVDQLGCDYFGHVTFVLFRGPAVTDDTMRQVGRLGRLRGLILDGTSVTDAGLASLRGLSHLDRLALEENPGIKGPGLANLRELDQLRTLDIETSKLDDADLIPVARLTGLTYLNLSYTPITDAGLAHLRGLVNLEALYLADTRVTSAGLDHLRGMARLKRLDLHGTRVDDLSPIRALEQMGHLRLWKTPITDAGLAPVSGFARLYALDFDDSKVTDAGLAHLLGLTRLKEVGLSKTAVTDAGIAAFREARPTIKLNR